jgi:hypothetical protein
MSMNRALQVCVVNGGSRWDYIAALVGESLREIAVLVIVFVPLETVVQGTALTARLWLAIIVPVAVLFTLGVYLETKRDA